MELYANRNRGKGDGMMEDPIAGLHDEVGEEKLRAMVAAFYRRVQTDDLIGPMYPDQDWEGAEKRLADFLVYRFGGAATYLEQRGHPRLRGRHMPFPIGVAERDRWLDLMGQAMREVEVPGEQVPLMAAFRIILIW